MSPFYFMNYQKIHDQIIERAKLENREKNNGIYYEAHHIIPLCLGGTGRVTQYKTHPNVVLLTAKEHYICHKLLCEIYPNNDNIFHAYWYMCNVKAPNQNRSYTISMKEYERIRTQYSQIISKRYKGRIPWNAGLTKETDKRVKKYGEAKKWNDGLKKGDNATLDRIHSLKMKKVKDLRTNIEYESISDGARNLNISRNSIHKFLKCGTFKYI
jgi:hypothetical protein